MKPVTLLIISRGKASLGRMFQGYMEYFNRGNLKVTVASTDIRTIHPLALDVMNEDGIDLDQSITLDYTKYDLASFDEILILGNVSNTVLQNLNGRNFRQFKIDDPLRSESYLNTVEQYRQVREELKRICIELIGNYSLVKS